MVVAPVLVVLLVDLVVVVVVVLHSVSVARLCYPGVPPPPLVGLGPADNIGGSAGR